MKNIDYSKIDNIVFDGVFYKDTPDYCDAYIVSANYNGAPMDEKDIEKISNEFVHQQLIEFLN